MFHGIRATLLDEIRSYCDENGLSEREFGVLMAHDHLFVSRLRNGMNVGVSRLEDVAQRAACHRAGEECTGVGQKGFRPGHYSLNREAA